MHLKSSILMPTLASYLHSSAGRGFGKEAIIVVPLHSGEVLLFKSRRILRRYYFSISSQNIAWS
jgi:hypothetical protein